jgi:hypothetical protein
MYIYIHTHIHTQCGYTNTHTCVKNDEMYIYTQKTHAHNVHTLPAYMFLRMYRAHA